MSVAVAPVWALSIKRISKDLPRERIPLLGIGAAFSFLIMMLNVPLPGGTSGHAVGGTLIAVLLGPYAAFVSVSVALLVQALVFGDGGILAFGANSFNMAFVIPFVGYFAYKFVKDRAKSKKGEYAGLAIASYLAINAAALFASVELGLQPLVAVDAAGTPLYCPYPLAISVPAMMVPTLLVAGLVEAAFTVSIVAFVAKASPGIAYAGSSARTKPLYALVGALVVASPLGLLASGKAWGEWGSSAIKAPLPDYAMAGVPGIVGYLVSAILGAALLVIAFKLVAFRKGSSLGTEEGHPER